MTYFPVANPYNIFTDTDGLPLENGYIYIGEANLNPVTNPITVYWDEAGLYPAAQPIRTVNGYPSRAGSAAKIYTNAGAYEDYSLLIKDRHLRTVHFVRSTLFGTGAFSNSVDTIADLRDINGYGQPIYVRGHTTAGDVGGGTFEWFDGAAPGTYTDDNGVTIVPTGGDGSGAWKRRFSGARNAAFYGIIGDYDIALATGTDNAVNMQAMFDTLYLTATESFAAGKKALISGVFDIEFNPGVYYSSVPLTIGADGFHLYGVKIRCNNGSMIYSDAGGVDVFAVTLYALHQCDIKLHVINSVGSAVKIDTVDNSTLDISAGCLGTYCLYTCGVVYNNQWDRVHLGQSAYQNGADYGWYGDWTYLTQDVFTGFPINNINILTMSGVDTGIYWIDDPLLTGRAGAVTINVLDHESAASIVNSVYIEEFRPPIIINSIWCETTSDNLFNFVKCGNVTINNMQSSGNSSPGARQIRIEDCEIVALNNIKDLDSINVVGTVNQLSLNNILFWSNSNRIIFTAGTQAKTYDNINLLNCNNIFVKDATGATNKGYFSRISNSQPSTFDNIILNPKSVDALGNVNTLFCSGVQDAGHTDISPLGFRETLIEITGIGSFAQLQLDVDTTKLSEETTKCTLLTCWKIAPVVGGANIITSGSLFDNKWTDYYGDIHFHITDGSANDWIITATLIDLDDARTYIAVVWNYATVYAIGDQFLFGGAILYGGHDIKLPQL